MGGHGEAGIPELFQHTHLHSLLFLRVFVLVQNFLGVSISRRQVPPGTPPYHLLLLICLVLHLPILKGGYAQAQVLRLPDHHILDGLEFFLLGQRLMFSGCVFVVALQLIPQPVPLLVALRHFRDLLQFIHDGVHLFLHRFPQITVDLFACAFSQQSGQRLHLFRDNRTVTRVGLHLPDETGHGFHGRVPHLLIGEILLLIEGQQFVLKDVIGQLRAHLLNPFLGQVALLRVV